MAVAAAPRVDNFAAALRATKDIVPYLILFYGINIFIWYNSTRGDSADAQLVSNMMISSVFLAGFWVIDFFRARGRMKAVLSGQPQVIVVQQPVYVPAPPGYAYPTYPPYAGYPPQGAPAPPPGLPASPPPAPPPSPPQKPPREGSA